MKTRHSYLGAKFSTKCAIFMVTTAFELNDRANNKLILIVKAMMTLETDDLIYFNYFSYSNLRTKNIQIII